MGFLNWESIGQQLTRKKHTILFVMWDMTLDLMKYQCQKLFWKRVHFGT